MGWSCASRQPPPRLFQRWSEGPEAPPPPLAASPQVRTASRSQCRRYPDLLRTTYGQVYTPGAALRGPQRVLLSGHFLHVETEAQVGAEPGVQARECVLPGPGSWEAGAPQRGNLREPGLRCALRSHDEDLREPLVRRQGSQVSTETP